MNEEKIEDNSIQNSVKKTPVKKKNKRKSSVKKTTKSKKSIRNFPIISLEESLKIGQKIKELNGGNPWTPKEVSRAIDVKNTSQFFYYTAASRDFGITQGTREAKEISLTDFGKKIIYAPNLDVEKEKKIEAFLNIKLFKDVLDYYKGNKLPEMKYLGNTLEDKFKLHSDYHEEFSKPSRR